MKESFDTSNHILNSGGADGVRQACNDDASKHVRAKRRFSCTAEGHNHKPTRVGLGVMLPLLLLVDRSYIPSCSVVVYACFFASFLSGSDIGIRS